jgi:hypothetical protein
MRVLFQNQWLDKGRDRLVGMKRETHSSHLFPWRRTTIMIGSICNMIVKRRRRKTMGSMVKPLRREGAPERQKGEITSYKAGQGLAVPFQKGGDGGEILGQKIHQGINANIIV